jgi:DNA-binding winged helix-turn-helix (wHTH) protein/Tol biopolymer transport system component
MMAAKSFVFRFDDVEVREREFSLLKDGKTVAVEPKAFRVLLFLLRNPKRLIAKEELLNAVWADAAVSEGSLTRAIWLLRGTLGDDTRSPRYIETVATVGYRFICPVEASEDVPQALEPANEARSWSDAGMTVGNRRWFWGWALAGGGVLFVCLASTIWYLSRPLPPPRITAATQITHDHYKKSLVGTDGSRLYVARTNENDFYIGMPSPESISEVAISDGESAQIPVAVPGSGLADVSADGSSLLVFSISEPGKVPNPIWNVRTLGGQARKLGEAMSASFLPDGNSVAYSTPQGEIWLVRSDGTGAHKLAAVKDPAYDFTWSPDGKFIRFGMDGRIWEMSSSGSGPHEVLPGWRPESSQCCGRWTPDGKFFLFLDQNQAFSPGGQLWALVERRGLLRRPEAEPILLAGGPTWWGGLIPGKDGKTIFAEGQTPRGEFSRFDAKTKRLQPFLGGISAQGAVFSKDGQYVAYVSFPEAILWKANRDGSNPVQLTDSSLWPILPRWSPDGTQIAFTARTATTAERIYVVPSDGGGPPRLLGDSNEWREWPYWSPDGRKVVFNFDSMDPLGNVQQVIHILDLDSHQATELPGSAGMNGPRWSPDGRYIAAGDGVHLKIFDFVRQEWFEVAQKGSMQSPEWSGDGKYIYFRRVKGDLGIFRISIEGGAAEKIVDLKDWHDAGWYGCYMGLDPTDTPLLLRDISSDDIYALTLEQK